MLLVLLYCSAYSLFCRRTASDINLNTIRALFIAVTTSCLKESATAKEFPAVNVPVDFFEFLSTEFDASSKPPSRENHRKVSYPSMQQRDRVLIEP